MGNAAAISKKAHQVVEVLPGSPGHLCGLKAKEDFIITIDGRDLMKMDAEEILEIVKVCCSLLLYDLSALFNWLFYHRMPRTEILIF